MDHFGPETAHPHNSGLALRIFLKLCRMKGANRYIKILLVVFSRKKFIWGSLIFLAFMSFFTVWLDMVNLSKATANWILKQSRHDFSGKHLCGGYCMDIMWRKCVEVKIHGFVQEIVM